MSLIGRNTNNSGKGNEKLIIFSLFFLSIITAQSKAQFEGFFLDPLGNFH
ncbi:MAG: hypothetical protein CM1200mP1_13100 [Candidatus Neomarinimicrobiota bacterium]|nr:MAG: hypothetical protein CM1200mP1_13100 [Candidatus Neomarinimicrobiota bacterium]